MLPLTDSTDLLEDGPSLLARFHEDGYVFLRQVIDPGLLLEVRDAITAVCARFGWFVPGSNPMDAKPSVAPCVEGEDRYVEVYDEIQRLEAFHAVPHDPTVRRCMTALLGETAFPHPLSIARLVFPDNMKWTTPPHQDYPNNQGTEALYACWMPLGDCPADLGSLSILRGSHRFGVAPMEFSLGAGNRRAKLEARFEQSDWVGGDFALGDTIIFHSLTVHRSLPNTTDRMRLSVDYRFQREGDELTKGCLEPHCSGRLGWEEIYRGWIRQDLKYYWRNKQYNVVPWDTTFHDLPSEHLRDAIQDRVSWRPQEFDALAAAIRQNPDDLKIVQERMRDRARQDRERSASGPSGGPEAHRER
jgi:ectoine hydroxylase-related dioxygenase (phytanoyl-CoA dioxygenase family)